MVDAPCICMAEPEAFQDELIGHIKYMGTPPGPSREVRLRRAPPAAQTPAGGARGGMLMLSTYGGRACTLSAERTPNPASPGHVEVHMYFVWGTLYADELILERSGCAIQIHGAPTM